MTSTDIQEHFDSMTDDELRAAIETAKADLQAAATDDPNSKWHEACFAGLLMYAGEASERGIRLATVH